MNKIEPYKDNILNKIKTNEEIKNLFEYVERYSDYGEEIKLSLGFLSQKLKINRDTFLKILKEIINYNDKMIDMYLGISAGTYKVKGEKENDNTKYNPEPSKQSTDKCDNGECTKS